MKWDFFVLSFCFLAQNLQFCFGRECPKLELLLGEGHFAKVLYRALLPCSFLTWSMANLSKLFGMTNIEYRLGPA